ncbi:hypothetical protein GCM10017602_00580 [Herbiconiux flava]|nr:hypothetical protein GCM10017602_00580 [Herbiconiux flava]
MSGMTAALEMVRSMRDTGGPLTEFGGESHTEHCGFLRLFTLVGIDRLVRARWVP